MVFGNFPPEMLLSPLLRMPPTAPAAAQHPLARWMQNKKLNKLDIYALSKKGKGKRQRERKRKKKRGREREKHRERKRKNHSHTQKGTKKYQVMMKPGFPRQHPMPARIPHANPIIYHCSDCSSAAAAQGRWAQWFWRSSLNPHVLQEGLARDVQTVLWRLRNSNTTISVSITKIPLSRDGAQADILAASWSQAKHFQTMLCEWAGPPAWAAGTISTWSKKFSHWKLDKWNHRDSKSSSKLTPKLYKIPFIAAHSKSADAEPREASSFISEPRSNPMALLHKHWDIYPAAGKSGLTFF